jgi:hypothetical protein
MLLSIYSLIITGYCKELPHTTRIVMSDNFYMYIQIMQKSNAADPVLPGRHSQF